MKIGQILNNNIALVRRGEVDVIVVSNGIAFKKKVGDSLTMEDVEKVFVPDSNDFLETYSYLLSNVDESTLNATLKAINYVEEQLKDRVNTYLYLTLLDHIDYALKRADKGQFVISPLNWEVRKFYPKEYQISKQILKIISEETKTEFPESEAVSIALHLINLKETQLDIEETIKIMETVNDMLGIIRHHFKLVFEEDSMNYNRLITHLQYFAQRLAVGKVYASEDGELNTQVRMMYPDSYLCVKKLGRYLKDHFNKEMTKDEETYLILHVHRVTKRSE
ncbi:MAG: PRD domain-containing protein [Enterococcus sp.]